MTYKGDPWFNVGAKSFALALDGRVVMKLERGRQELLFEIRPETFSRCRVATAYWSYVELANIDEAELADLVLEAWTLIVPRRVSRAHLASRVDTP